MQNPSLNRFVEWHPLQRNLFVAGYGNRLELVSINQESPATPNGKTLDNRANVIRTRDIPTPPNAIQNVVCSCLNWHPQVHSSTKSFMAYGTSSGIVSMLNWSNFNEEVLDTHILRLELLIEVISAKSVIFPSTHKYYAAK
jgi:hypothetical protein